MDEGFAFKAVMQEESRHRVLLEIGVCAPSSYESAVAGESDLLQITLFVVLISLTLRYNHAQRASNRLLLSFQ